MAADPYARKFAPLVGHWSVEHPDIVINRDGSLMAMRHISGFPADLAGARATVALHLRDNALMRSVADRSVEWWDHFVRQDGQDMASLPESNNWFANRFDAAYRATQGAGSLFRNDLFVTLVMHPADGLRGGLAALFGTGAWDHPQATVALLQDFVALLQKVDAGLARYGVRALSIRERDGVAFSEVAEALSLILNNRFTPIGLSEGAMGRLLVQDRMVFGRGEFHAMHAAGERFGAMLTFHDYPARTRPGMFADLRGLRFPLVITGAFQFAPKAQALGKLSLRVKQMQSGNDAAKSQVQELAQDEDDVQSGRSAYGTHHWSAAIYAPDLETLDRRVAQAQSTLADVGVTAARESDALLAAYHAQLPGNRRWRTRPGQTKTINACGMAARHDVPRGTYNGRWGAPIIMLRTLADTEYAFHFQVQGSAQIPAEDLGNCLLIGPAGSGKTALMGTVDLLALRNPATRVVVIDKDYGLSVMVRAAGGSYLVLQSGAPSGLAPLRGLTGSDEDRAFVERFVRGLILADGAGDLSADEDQRLGQAVARQMQMPAAMRTLGGIAVMLGQRSKDGAAARLRKWCRGERLGWAFDNETDDLRLDTRMIGFDTTALLRDEIVCSPTLSYLFYRVRKLIDGNPIVLSVDEFWQTDRVAAFRDENNDQLKTIRKNEGVVLLATQSARDALNSPNSHTFQQQVPTKVFFGDESASREDLCDGMGLTEAEYLAVTQTLPNLRHTFLIKRPGGSVMCRFDLSGMRAQVAVVSARRSTYDLMNRLIARHGSDPELWVPHYERQAPTLAEAATRADEDAA